MGHLLLGISPKWGYGLYTLWNSRGDKLISCVTRGVSVVNSFLVKTGLFSLFPSQGSILSDLNICVYWISQIICMISYVLASERHYFLGVIHHHYLLQSFCLCIHRSLSLKGRGLLKTSHLE